MSWIREEDLKAIRAQADIVDIMSRYLSLSKKGKNYEALCPFHDDHDPSLSISTDKQIFKCFVCGAGGDVFGFVQKIENISFPEAVAKVAEMIGYPLAMPKDAFVPKVDPLKSYHDIMQAYISYMQYELKSEAGSFAMDYLHKRKINEDILTRFEIGFAPDADASKRYFEAKKYDKRVLKELGLMNGDRVVFHNRFVIPIHDAKGNPIGFTARKLTNAGDDPKYINSPQTKLYEKGQVVFNYHRAKVFAHKAHRAILVEGAMDVLAFEKADIHESIACLGTACTKEQLGLIKALRVPVTICYDGDRAGQDATYKFGKMAVQAQIEVVVVKNTTNKDPDEIFDAGGKEELSNFVLRTISFVDFLFDYLLTKYNLDNYEDRKAYGQELFEAIDRLANSFEKDTYLARLKEKTGFDFQKSQVPQPKKKEKQRFFPMHISRPMPGRDQAERAMLNCILLSKSACQRFRDEIGFFKDSRIQKLSLYCYDIYRSKDRLDMDTMMARINEEELRSFLMQMWNDPYRIKTFDEMFFEDSMNKMKSCALQEQIDALNAKIKTVADPIAKAKLSIEKQRLLHEQGRISYGEYKK